MLPHYLAKPEYLNVQVYNYSLIAARIIDTLDDSFVFGGVGRGVAQGTIVWILVVISITIQEFFYMILCLLL